MADAVVKRKFWHVLDASGQNKEQVLLETSADQVTLRSISSLSATNVQAAVEELKELISEAGSVNDVKLYVPSGDAGEFKSIVNNNKNAQFQVVTTGNGDAISGLTITVDSTTKVGTITLNKSFIKPGILASLSGTAGAFVSGVTATYDSTNNRYNISYTQKDLKVSGSSTGDYVSEITVNSDGDGITYTKASLPSITTTGGTAETGKYIASVTSDGHTITVTKGILPTESSITIATPTGSGNAITSLTASGHTITPNKGETFLVAADITGKEDKSNKTTTIDGNSTTTQYPSAATVRDFVNSSIEANAARYLTSDAAGNPFANYEAFKTATKFYYAGEEKTPTANDYVIVLKDESKGNAVEGYTAFTTTNQYVGYYVYSATSKAKVEVTSANKDSLGITPGTTPAYQTSEDPTTRYTYVKTAEASTGTWQFQYIVNNTGFTAAQWKAVNSGVDSTKVAQIATNAANITALQTNKQDVITTTNKLSASLVDDSASTNKFVTEAQRTQIGTNASNITTLQSDKADKTSTVTNVAYDTSAGKLTQTINGTTTDIVTVATIKSKMGLATVATSGSYADLSNKPTVNGTALSALTIQEGSNISVTTSGSTITIAGDYEEATQATAGLMSSSDKTKLDGIASGAQANVIENVAVSGKLTGTTTITNKVATVNVTAVSDAAKWTTARNIGVTVNSGTNASGTDIISTEAKQSIDGSANKTIAVTLADSGVTANTASSPYSAFVVNAKGIVTAGGSMVEWGTTGQTTPTGSLMAGGLFFELQ